MNVLECTQLWRDVMIEISKDLLEVMEAMQKAAHNPHLRLKGTQHERYRRFSIETEDEIDLRFTIDELLATLANTFPDGDVPEDFNIASCLKEI